MAGDSSVDVFCCGASWKCPFKESHSPYWDRSLLAPLDLYYKQFFGDDKFCKDVYSEWLTSYKRKAGWHQETPRSRILWVEDWVFALRIKIYETLRWLGEFLTTDHMLKHSKFKYNYTSPHIPTPPSNLSPKIVEERHLENVNLTIQSLHDSAYDFISQEKTGWSLSIC